MTTVFAKIIAGEIPAEIVYENDDLLAFRDIAPQAPVHVVIIPRKPLRSLSNTASEDAPLLGQLLRAAAQIARTLGVDESGYRVVVNAGPDGGQSVDHLHLHLLAGRHLTWPPG